MNTVQAVQAIDQAWNRAYANNDRATLDRVLADEWTAINAVGQIMTKQQILAQVTAVPWPFTTYEFAEVQVRLYSMTAIVTGRLMGTGYVDGQVVQVDQRYLRVYVQRDSQWQAVVTQVTPVPPHAVP